MDIQSLPLVVDPDKLETLIGDPDLLILDLTQPKIYRQMHVPGAIYVEYADIVASRRPVNGLLPDINLLENVFSQLGVAGRQVVAYDDEGGGKAARLIWTLNALGHQAASLLDGGIHAWANENHPMESEEGIANAAEFKAEMNESVIADAAFIQSHLQDKKIRLLDARSLGEFSGAKRFSANAGHIPGAIHWDYADMLDQQRNLRLRSSDELLKELDQRGFKLSDEVICYCQTHHRSSLSYVVLRHLGVSQVRGYPGSWSDWGNRSDLPVE